MTRQSQMKEATQEKAKNYNRRVQQKLENYQKEICEAKETRMFRIEEKI